MSERVVFTTVHQDGFPPNHVGIHTRLSSAFSGFPFPYSYGVTARPIIGPISLATAVEYYWRVRKWRVTGSITVHYNGDPGISDTKTFDDSIVIGYGPGDVPDVPRRERDLIYPSPLTGIIEQSASTPPLDGSVTAGISLFQDAFVSGVGMRNVFADSDGGVYIPVDFSVGFGTLPSPIIFVAAGTDGVDAGHTIDFAGFTLVMGTLNPGVVGVDACTLAVSPDAGTTDAFWPYAGTDGLPIYDTSTGALLSGRTPRS